MKAKDTYWEGMLGPTNVCTTTLPLLENQQSMPLPKPWWKRALQLLMSKTKEQN